jgi:hypothetical protein
MIDYEQVARIAREVKESGGSRQDVDNAVLAAKAQGLLRPAEKKV